MRRLRYNVAMSLDGYIADGQERFDWIPNDDASQRDDRASLRGPRGHWQRRVKHDYTHHHRS
jgi:hypothetical protein